MIIFFLLNSYILENSNIINRISVSNENINIKKCNFFDFTQFSGTGGSLSIENSINITILECICKNIGATGNGGSFYLSSNFNIIEKCCFFNCYSNSYGFATYQNNILKGNLTNSLFYNCYTISGWIITWAIGGSYCYSYYNNNSLNYCNGIECTGHFIGNPKGESGFNEFKSNQGLAIFAIHTDGINRNHINSNFINNSAGSYGILWLTRINSIYNFIFIKNIGLISVYYSTTDTKFYNCISDTEFTGSNNGLISCSWLVSNPILNNINFNYICKQYFQTILKKNNLNLKFFYFQFFFSILIFDFKQFF